MKRAVAWSKVGTCAEAVLSKTRTKSTIILEAICAIIGAINVKIRRPRALVQSEKRKSRTCAVACKDPGRGSTVTGQDITSTLCAIRWIFWKNMSNLRDTML